MSFLSLSSRPVHISFSIPSYVIPLGALSICLFTAFRFKPKDGNPEPLDNAVRSPLKTILPTLSKVEQQALPYPPDLFLGARDVDTPFGSLRVYEWGPETGRKVLLVHGISTPCLSLGLLAQNLVDNGCRVMIFDLFGRGYSDDPSDLKHDSRLYITQILLAIASSDLAWTGTNGFSIIGYSLGGGISAAFTDTFPGLVDSLILLAPSGVVRLKQIAWSSKFLYQAEGVLPEPLIHYLVRRRLWTGTVSGAPRTSEKADATTATAAELGSEPTALYPDHPQVNITAAVQWQIQHHSGFIPAFISSIRHAPITNQHAAWTRIGQRLTAQKGPGAYDEIVNEGMSTGKVLLILGSRDPLITVAEVKPDAEECFRKKNLETAIIDGGHELPTSHAAEVADVILNYWKGNWEDTM